LKHIKANYIFELENRSCAAMILEEQRFLHEDLERLEQGIADRVADEPRHVSSQPRSDPEPC
jgi:hypothetical protein